MSFRAVLTVSAAVLATVPARAEVTKFEVLSREMPAFEGRSFGTSGQFEKITARATIALDPANPRNAVIADIAAAPRNAQGRVEATTDVVILRPAHANGALLFEVLNRGRKLLPGWSGDTDGTASIRLGSAADAGNGFLMDQGFTVVWAGWQPDAPKGPGLLAIDVPTVPGITGRSREEFQFDGTPGPKRATLSYPAADQPEPLLTVHARADEPRQTPPGLAVRFVDPMTVEITRPEGMPATALYELTYTARDPKVMGLGLAAIRDVTAFLRREGGAANPLARNGRSGIDRAIGLGISQSGRVLRDVLYYGLNEDEQGRPVFDGAMPIIPGARRSFSNARWAQMGRNPGPQYDRLYPVLQFPFTYGVTDDPVSGKRDGILLRCSLSNTCPKVMQADSEFEFWGSQASLVVTDTQGRAIDLPSNVRAYLFAGTPHGNQWDAVATANPACALRLNPNNGAPTLRALIVAMDRWLTEGRDPPASRYPQRGQGTLVAARDVYPAIPGLGYRGQYVRAEWIVDGAARAPYPLFLPRAGLDGNVVAGVRLPILAAPRATYTGWNAQAGVNGPQELCTQLGGVLPLPATRADREASGDPRPSLEELYPTPGAYADAVRAAADDLVAARLMLPADADAVVRAAEDGTLAKLGR